MEKRDLYDQNRNLTNKIYHKGDPIPFDHYFITVVVWIENSKGELLIQKRTDNKNGMYGTTGGHPKSGESSKEGLITEVKEEIGIDLSNTEITLIKTIKSNQRFLDIYHIILDININDCVLEQEEVDSVEWMDKSRIEDLITESKFMPSHVTMYQEYLKYKNEREEDENKNN